MFVAADVCRALEIQNHKDAIKRLDSDEISGVVLTDPHGRPQETNCVTESGLYSLVLGSRKPEAKAFKRWITNEALPTIRKTGGYYFGAPFWLNIHARLTLLMYLPQNGNSLTAVLSDKPVSSMTSERVNSSRLG